MIKRKVRVKDPSGLHARSARNLVDEVEEFEARVRLRNDDTEADANSIMEILMLAASAGSELELIVEGADEEQATERLEEFFEEGFRSND